jgi:uncharacterized protein
MPQTPTYPGVYIEEISSGVRTIVGVATSITAFVGRTARGPVDDPKTINGFGDFERIFGGLDLNSPLSYAVRDFFINGGGQAIIVRIYPTPDENQASIAQLRVGGLLLQAASPGTWGNSLRAAITVPKDDDKDAKAFAEAYGIPVGQLFNLYVRDDKTKVVEQYLNLSHKAGNARSVDKVLESMSSLVRVSGDLPANRPTSTLLSGSQTTSAGNTTTTTSSSSGGSPTTPATNAQSSSSQTDIFSDANSVTVANRLPEDLNKKSLEATNFTGDRNGKKGLYALEKADLFNILCIPPDSLEGNITNGILADTIKYCVERRAFLIIDPPSNWTSKDTAKEAISGFERNKNAAIFFPRIIQPNPLRGGQLETFAPSGAIAGVFARTDTTRGVWKAPAGLDATLNGVTQLSVPLTDAENGELNPLGINCLRSFPNIGRIVWGSRTLRGADILADEYKYIPVRRLALYIEESLYRGTQWVVFEPNDEPLWAQIRLNVGAFMQNLFRQGAFQGQTPREAYFVKCDKETTIQNDINLGIVNIIVGFAPLKPAEFVFIKLQQMAGQVVA